jgi:hypothetical protein
MKLSDKIPANRTGSRLIQGLGNPLRSFILTLLGHVSNQLFDAPMDSIPNPALSLIYTFMEYLS